MGGRHYSSTINHEVDIIETGRKLKFRKCVLCIGGKTVTGNDDTLEVEGLGKVFENIG